jgi:hypothetical protein
MTIDISSGKNIQIVGMMQEITDKEAKRQRGKEAKKQGAKGTKEKEREKRKE